MHINTQRTHQGRNQLLAEAFLQAIIKEMQIRIGSIDKTYHYEDHYVLSKQNKQPSIEGEDQKMNVFRIRWNLDMPMELLDARMRLVVWFTRCSAHSRMSN